jgi:hypothetical protein
MKNLIIFMSLFISSILFAEMKPLQEEREGMDPKQLTSLIYIAERCGALYAFSAILSSAEDNEDINAYIEFDTLKEFYESFEGQEASVFWKNTYLSDANLLIESAVAANVERNLREKKFFRGSRIGVDKSTMEVWEKVVILIKNYQKISKDHFLKSGERINSLIESDLSLCKPFLNSVREQQS